MSGDGPSVTLTVPDDFSTDLPDTIRLRLRIDEWTVDDAVEVTWNGDTLSDPNFEYADLNSSMGYAMGTTVWQWYELSPDRVPTGDHKIKAILRHRNPHLIPDLILTDVELVIDYGEAQR
jgi:hypothetical protein